jgi:hypothetical protein
VRNSSKLRIWYYKKFFGWVMSGCSNTCMTWSQKFNYFRKRRGKIVVILLITTGYVTCVCSDITQHTSEMSINLQRTNHLINDMFGEEPSIMGNAVTVKQYEEYEEKFTFFNKNSAPIFKIHASVKPHPTYFQCSLTLILKLFQPNFE